MKLPKAKALGLALLAALHPMASLHAQEVISELEDPSKETGRSPIKLDPEFASVLPSTVSIGGEPAVNPAPPSAADYPLSIQHWDALSPEGKITVAGILSDGLRASGTFKNCDAIEAQAMAAGIDEWMTNGDRTEAVMTIAAFIAYSVCPIAIPSD